MSLSVAPLTTVVMTAVDQDHVGTASGINNAISRVAGVLSVAVLGVVMVAGFRTELNRQLKGLKMPGNVRSELQADTMRLAALKPPPEVDVPTAASIEFSISSSFVFSFRRIMWICSVLSLASSVVAFQYIPGMTTAQAPRDAVSAA